MRKEQRTLRVGVKHLSLRFDSTTWQAIDLLAKRTGQRWTRWVRAVIATDPEAINAHGVIREAVVQGLLDGSVESVFDERAEMTAMTIPPLLACAGTLDDEQLREEWATAALDEAAIDLFSVELRTGLDGEGRPCLWIRNRLEGAMHYMVPFPFTPQELAARVGAADKAGA